MEDAELEQRKAGAVVAAVQVAANQEAVDSNRLNNRSTEARKSILNQILQPEAADRLGRIRLVKEQRATDVENRLIMLARTGQLRQKVTEDQLKELLNAVAESSQHEDKIVVDRRKGWDDDDDDDLFDL
ncbi:putative dsdna-binding protein pdcd5 protein [Eutypa lata UCREL1]|uniref:Putative dsdna-binding protein pdcd5 protein n=1 Tax=Eutypa lata (strain UCR-EL1) TaxID=1287681 RepID=M7SMB1_EUTLA|nr:putative dsdna-binding protein pdcd5 protein [Eutypa lata UCREL1]